MEHDTATGNESTAGFMLPYLWERKSNPPLPYMRAYAADVADALADIADRHGLTWRADPALGGIALYAPETNPDEQPDECVEVRLTVRPTPKERRIAFHDDAPATPAYLRHETHELRALAVRSRPGGRAAVAFADQWPDPDDIDPEACADIDTLCGRVLSSLGISQRPPIPKAGTYGPTGARMDHWMDMIRTRLEDMAHDNRNAHVFEEDDECYHVQGGYVTERQMDRILPEGLQRDRYMTMENMLIDTDEASLHWTDPDWWSDRVDAAIENDDGSGVYWTTYIPEDDAPTAVENPTDTPAPLADPDPASPAETQGATPAGRIEL